MNTTTAGRVSIWWAEERHEIHWEPGNPDKVSAVVTGFSFYIRLAGVRLSKAANNYGPHDEVVYWSYAGLCTDRENCDRSRRCVAKLCEGYDLEPHEMAACKSIRDKIMEHEPTGAQAL